MLLCHFYYSNFVAYFWIVGPDLLTIHSYCSGCLAYQKFCLLHYTHWIPGPTWHSPCHPPYHRKALPIYLAKLTQSLPRSGIGTLDRA
jgi:hypothetical protein